MKNPSQRAIHSFAMMGVTLLAFFSLFYVLAYFDAARGEGILRIFFLPRNLWNLTQVLLPIALTAIGASFVFSRGSFDFSIGGVMYLASAVAASLLATGWVATVPAAIMALIVALAVGLVNALVARVSKTAGFLVTIAAGAFARYMGLAISNVSTLEIPGNNGNATAFAICLVILAAAAFCAVCLLQFPGRAIPSAAAQESAPQGYVRRLFSAGWPYLLSALLAGAAGIFMMVRLNCSTPGIGNNYDLYSILAIALSGSFLGARYGNILGVILGALFVAVLSNLLSLLNVSSVIQMLCFSSGILVWFLVNTLVARIMFPERRKA
jgi:ribose transport system permease protein